MTIDEFADDVARWSVATFGEHSIGTPSFAKIREESREFFENPCDEEAADIIIALFSWSFRSNGDLPSVILTKWNEVKSRTDQVERDVQRGIPGI